MNRTIEVEFEDEDLIRMCIAEFRKMHSKLPEGYEIVGSRFYSGVKVSISKLTNKETK